MLLVTSWLCVKWALKNYNYFFGATRADQLGITLFMLIAFWVFYTLRHRVKLKKYPVFIILLLSLPLVLYPSISFLITLTDLSWIVVYLFIIISAGGLVILLNPTYLVLFTLSLGVAFLIPFGFRKEQLQFYDRVEKVLETRYGEVQLVKWKEDFWVYYNHQLQFSTLDRHMYQEGSIQPVMQLMKTAGNFLLIGGTNGMLEDELSKFGEDIDIDILAMDREFYDFMRNNEFVHLNEIEGKQLIADVDFFAYLASHTGKYDVIIVDLPDPVNVHYDQYYSSIFYERCYEALRDSGFLVTQTGDVDQHYAETRTIWDAIEATGFNLLTYHCQIPTIGQWSWVIAAKGLKTEEMLATLNKIKEKTETRWWNQEAMDMMLSSGKPDYLYRTVTDARKSTLGLSVKE